MTKWEYKTKYTDSRGASLLEMLNKLGEEGWELIAVDGCQYCFKRIKKIK
jgi:hypothetical protein